ncbi:MAG: toxin-activating lysine-acyltransferase [Pseudomonadota bacterium]
MSKTNGTETSGENGRAAPQIDPEVAAKVAALRTQVRESFGKIVMAMMMMPRYRHQTLGDLQHLVLEPLIRDRVAIAYPKGAENAPMTDVSGMAIWASVSDEVERKIMEQIRAGVFPVRLNSADWDSGDNNWLLDVVAPDAKTTAAVISNFKQIVKEGSLKLHPLITRLVDADTLKEMGAQKMG